MDIIYKRPIVSFCIMLVIGIIVAFVSNSLAVVICLLILLIVLLLTSGFIRAKGAVVPVVMLTFYLLGSIEFLVTQAHRTASFAGYDSEYVEVEGYIASAPEVKGEKVSYIVQASSIKKIGENQYRALRGKILLSTPRDSEQPLLEYGREITFEGRLTEPGRARNPGGFDYRLYLAQKGAGACVFAYHYDIVVGEGVRGNFLIKAGLTIRSRIVYVIENSLPKQQAGLMNGMLIGYREGLSEEVKAAFSDAGLLHIMAVSGANVAFLVIPVSFLLKMLKVRKKAANLMIIAFLNLFVCVTGFEPSVLRAVFMACVLLLSALIYREPDVYSAIAVSCIIMLIINPCMFFNIGFQLSYTATLGIVMLYGNISRLISCRFIPKKAADVIGATLAAQLGVFPITLIHFNKVSVIAIIPNILSAPLLEITTVLGAVMAVVGQFSLTLSRLVGYLNNIFLSALLYITKWSASVPYASVRTITPSLALAVIYYLLIWFFLWYAPQKGIHVKLKHTAAAFLITCAIFTVCLIRPGVLNVVFLDVGQGDCILVRTCSGRTVLIDGGGSTNPAMDSKVGELTVVPYLLDSGTGCLDAVIATHAHSDHVQGLIDVIDMIKVRCLIIPSLEDMSYFDELLNAAFKKGIPVSACSSGDMIKLDDQTEMHVLSPENDCSADEKTLNNTSLVIKLCYEETSILFMGDAEMEIEEKLIKKNAALPESGSLLDADIIKIGHHGSNTSTCEAFIEMVDPDAAVISTGRNNFGHPSQRVLDVLEKNGVRTFRTDMCGAVVLVSDGRRIRIKRTVEKQLVD